MVRPVNTKESVMKFFFAGVLLLSYCIFRNDTLFTFVQVINITAIMATIILARRANPICPYHLERALGGGDRKEMVKRAA